METSKNVKKIPVHLSLPDIMNRRLLKSSRVSDMEVGKYLDTVN